MRLEKLRRYFVCKIVPGIFYLLVICILLGIFRLSGFDYTFTLSNSMEPTFKVNAFILAEKVPYQEINIGDIIANQTEQYDKWVVHRVIDKKMVNGKTIALMTKGDNNELVDVQGATADSYKFKVIWHTNAFVPLITVLFGTLTNIKIKILKIGISILIVFVTGGLVGKQFWILINQIMKGAKSHDNNK